MVQLQVIYNAWNDTQKEYYKDVLEALLQKNVQTNQLLKIDIQSLSNATSIPRQKLRAFTRQVQHDVGAKSSGTVVTEEYRTKKYPIEQISTGFESLDTLLLHGFQFNQILEIYGDSDVDKMNFISRLLTSFIKDYSKDNIFLFDTSGILEPRRLKTIDIECFQAFNLKNLLQSMENVAALLSSTKHTHPPLIIMDNPSKLIGFDWSVPEVSSLVKFIQLLARDLNACVILLQQNINTIHKSNETWKSMIDLQLHLSRQFDGTVMIKVLKCRYKIAEVSCTTNLQ